MRTRYSTEELQRTGWGMGTATANILHQSVLALACLPGDHQSSGQETVGGVLRVSMRMVAPVQYQTMSATTAAVNLQVLVARHQVTHHCCLIEIKFCFSSQSIWISRGEAPTATLLTRPDKERAASAGEDPEQGSSVASLVTTACLGEDPEPELREEVHQPGGSRRILTQQNSRC